MDTRKSSRGKFMMQPTTKMLITKQDAFYFQRLKYKVYALYKEMEILSFSTRYN